MKGVLCGRPQDRNIERETKAPLFVLDFSYQSGRGFYTHENEHATMMRWGVRLMCQPW
jgi:hypothetical protein